MQGESRQGSFTSRAIAYLKANVTDTNGPAITVSRTETPVLRSYVEPLLLSYVVDAGNYFELVQERHLEQDGLDDQTLHRIGLKNLAQLVGQRPTRVHPYRDIFAVTMGGDFEASLLLLDPLWDQHFRQFVRGDYAAVVPARDVLAFCDASSTAGLDELRQVVQRVFPGGDHVLSDRLYVRRSGSWSLLARIEA